MFPRFLFQVQFARESLVVTFEPVNAGCFVVPKLMSLPNFLLEGRGRLYTYKCRLCLMYHATVESVDEILFLDT